MVKIFRNIRKNYLDRGKLRRYLLYAIGEIILVVVGILIALAINNRNNRKQLRLTEEKVYQDINHQIIEDAEVLENVIEYNNNYLRQLEYANQIIEEKDIALRDTLGKIIPGILRYSDYNRSGNIYENLVSSGNIKYVKNSDIIYAIQNLEEHYNYMNRMEEHQFQFILDYAAKGIAEDLNFSTGEIVNIDNIYNYKFQNLLHATLDMMEEKKMIYFRATAEIDSIQKLINLELEK